MQLVLIIAGLVVLLLAARRLAVVSRQVSRNNRRIRLRDTDLAAWIADYDEALFETGHGAADEALDRYAEQLRDAQRTLQAVAASEGAAHRAVRALTGRPVPGLTATQTMAGTVARWEGPDEADAVRAA
jgi:ABC-type transport system involved in cytochrome bd biosynthesis fused ATPase/permease subunit